MKKKKTLKKKAGTGVMREKEVQLEFASKEKKS